LRDETTVSPQKFEIVFSERCFDEAKRTFIE
jgi:hypothetical protein